MAETPVVPGVRAYTRKLPQVLVDVEVHADLESAVNGFWVARADSEQTRQERRASELEAAVKEFHAFIRDHRSMDHVRLHVERKYEDKCAVCRDRWEPVFDAGVEVCSHCGAEVEPEGTHA